MTAYEIILKKKNGSELSYDEIKWLVDGYVAGEIPDYQMSAFLMAVCFNSLSGRETSDLTMIMAESGDMFRLSLDGFSADKHSTGGVGDKTSFITAPLAAACGVYVPKMSGRGLGHTGGTIDKLESVPGLRTSLDYDEFTGVVKKAGFCIAGQTGSLCPADKKIYALRSCTAAVDSIPLICSSIMSKKLAAGADGIVLDVKVGGGAFMKNTEDAVRLAEAMVSAGKKAGKKCSAVLTGMDKPLGMSVGNSLEVIEAIETLKGRGPEDLAEVSVTLAAEMLELAGKGSPEKCRSLAEEALNSGAALKKLEKMIELQNGDPHVIYDYSLFPKALYSCEVYSPEDGVITGISCEKTGLISLSLGAGRKTKDAALDYSAGIVFDRTTGDTVRKGERLAVLYSSSMCDFSGILSEFTDVFQFGCEEMMKNQKNIIKFIKGY